MPANSGCGLNVLNLPPITSLAQLQPGVQAKLSVEKTAAVILAKFESMWTVFAQNSGSFAPFMDLYLKRWLHSLVATIPELRRQTHFLFAATNSSL
jgi:biotin--protein ligase